jgi:DNA (cytosine-5)-methyltransferase 1
MAAEAMTKASRLCPPIKCGEESLPLKAIDLYCGAGAVTSALIDTGYSVIAAVEFDPAVAKTYRANHPDVHLVERDIRRVRLKDLVLKVNTSEIDLLAVCAPCQPFSNQNHMRHKPDKRRDLILQSIRFARRFKPKLIFFENVAGLVSPKFAPLLKALAKSLRKLGYELSAPQKVDAADFGVPQRRVRCIMVASRLGVAPIPPLVPTKIKRRTVRHAFSGLHRLNSGQKDSSDTLHFARSHSAINLRRLAAIPKNGGSRDSLPVHLQLRCHIGYKGHPDVYGRMRYDSVAPTLTTGCTDITRGRFAHPTQHRAITLREAARLQTFPDRYIFHGCASEIALQIGNAVPYRMMKIVAKRLLKILRSTD